MKKFCTLSAVLILLASLSRASFAAPDSQGFSGWMTNRANSSYFPIAVWLQDPRNADRYKAAGINLYIGLWRGPTSNQLAALAKAGMPVICDQNSFALNEKDNPIIAAWMHGDEPDNAQSLGQGKGYGPPVTPEKIVKEYNEMRAADPSRPVLLNLGQSVAWDNYIGRGVRRNHPEDYPRYIQGCDIVSFDIYPVVHDNGQIRGKLEYVARGVDRLREWSGGKKIVWNCIECTHIGDPERKATPEQVRSEVWMSLIHGSQGLIYFVHEFKPRFKEAALLSDPEMLQAVTKINSEVRELAPVLNSETVTNLFSVRTEPNDSTPIAIMSKQHAGKSYLFAVAMRNEPVTGKFHIQSANEGGTGSAGPVFHSASVLGENRSVPIGRNGEFQDSFKGYGVHLYVLE
jgi:hypothetical protein